MDFKKEPQNSPLSKVAKHSLTNEDNATAECVAGIFETVWS